MIFFLYYVIHFNLGQNCDVLIHKLASEAAFEVQPSQMLNCTMNQAIDVDRKMNIKYKI
jgi:hypothetical protein